MLPVVLASVRAKHAGLGMYAAPGSKSSQVLDILNSKIEDAYASRFVANEIDFKGQGVLKHFLKA